MASRSPSCELLPPLLGSLSGVWTHFGFPAKDETFVEPEKKQHSFFPSCSYHTPSLLTTKMLIRYVHVCNANYLFINGNYHLNTVYRQWVKNNAVSFVVRSWQNMNFSVTYCRMQAAVKYLAEPRCTCLLVLF